MATSTADLTLAEAQAGLARVRAAIATWESTGVIDYGIADRRGRFGIKELRDREQYYVQQIRKLEGVNRPLRRIVPVDLR